MRADIAVRQRAENSVDQRVETDVAVGMSEKSAVVRHANTANHHVIAVAEGVHIVTGPGSDIAEPGCETGFLADKIFRCRQFHVRRIAFKCRHRQSRPFRQRRVVGEIAAAFAGGAAVRVENNVESERLRRLRDPQARALRCRFDVAVAPTSLTVSVTGIAGIAAPVRPAASIAREISAAETNGLAASWMRTTSGFWPARASRPAWTEACRVAPPFAGGS